MHDQSYWKPITGYSDSDSETLYSVEPNRQRKQGPEPTTVRRERRPLRFWNSSSPKMSKKSPKSDFKGNGVSADLGALLAPILELEPKQQAAMLSMIAAARNTSDPRQRAGRGYYQDPKSGKTFRLRKKSPRSANRRKAESQVRSALRHLSQTTEKLGWEWVPKSDKSPGHVIDRATRKKIGDPNGNNDYQRAVQLLANARENLATVREYERNKRSKKSKNSSTPLEATFDGTSGKWVV